MQAARFKAKNDIVSHLKPTALYALAAPSIPESIQATVIAKLQKGEYISKNDIQRMLDKMRLVESKDLKLRTSKASRAKQPKTKKLSAPKAFGAEDNRAVQSKSKYPQFVMTEEIRKKMMQQLPPADKLYFWARIHRTDDDQLMVVELVKHQPTK